MAAADTDSGALISEVGRMNGNGAGPLPAAAGRHRASGADG
jgi:hypothetical protein